MARNELALAQQIVSHAASLRISDQEFKMPVMAKILEFNKDFADFKEYGGEKGKQPVEGVLADVSQLIGILADLDGSADGKNLSISLYYKRSNMKTLIDSTITELGELNRHIVAINPSERRQIKKPNLERAEKTRKVVLVKLEQINTFLDKLRIELNKMVKLKGVKSGIQTAAIEPERHWLQSLMFWKKPR